MYIDFLWLSMEEEMESSEAGSSSMHMFSAGPMNPLVATPKLPTPALGNMQECERVIKQISRQPRLKEKLTDLILMNVSSQYLRTKFKQY